MTTGTCRRDGCDKPRRIRRGMREPLCEDCYRQARQRVTEQLADEATPAGRKRFRSFRLGPGQAARASGSGPKQRGGAKGGSQLIGEELLREARRLHALGLSLRAVAETLLDETGYANARSAEQALRSQLKRHGRALEESATRSPERTLRAAVMSPAGGGVSTGAAGTMSAMAIDTPTHRLAPEPERPYWQNEAGERLTFQQALARGDAQVTAEQHAEAICAIAHAAARARLRGEEREARRLAHAAARLCGEIVGLWPHDSWKPIR